MSGGPARSLPPGEDPGETVRVQIAGTSRSDDGLVVDVIVTCDRAVSGGIGVRPGDPAGGPRAGGRLRRCGPRALRRGPRAGRCPSRRSRGSWPAGRRTSRRSWRSTTPRHLEFFDLRHARASVRLHGRPARHRGSESCPNPSSRITISGATRDTAHRHGHLRGAGPGRALQPRAADEGTHHRRGVRVRADRLRRIPPPSRSSSTGTSAVGVHPPSSSAWPSRRRRAGTSSSGMTSRPPRSTSGADGPPRPVPGSSRRAADRSRTGHRRRRVGRGRVGVGAPGAERQLRRGALPVAGGDAGVGSPGTRGARRRTPRPTTVVLGRA